MNSTYFVLLFCSWNKELALNLLKIWSDSVLAFNPVNKPLGVNGVPYYLPFLVIFLVAYEMKQINLNTSCFIGSSYIWFTYPMYLITEN